MAIAELKAQLQESDYETIEQLAEQNKGPRDIAKILRVSLRDFMHLWRDKTSRVRESYNHGQLQIEVKKGDALIRMIEADNTTAYQIHEKQKKQRDFEDARLDVFGV